MKKLIIGLALVVLLLVPAACAGGATEGGRDSNDEYPTPTEPSEPTAPGTISWDGNGGDESYTSVTTEEERMIVRTGNMSLVVEDISQTVEDITQMSLAFGGYVVSSYVSGEEEDMRGWISFRVPDDKFETALEQLRDMAVRVELEQTYSQDVTEEYIDLQARLGNAEATEQQYLALLDKAVEIEDILDIYDYLSRIRSEIEQLKGRIQYLEQTTSTSLIEVSLEPEEAVVGGGWSALGVLKAAARGLVTAGKVLGTLVIWLLIFIPIWGTVLGIILWRRHKKKKAAK
ncbi:MAG: DUF4349 domain-containing protein [Dehalococcoidia bacterium]|jgi:hypothetical protein